MCGAPTSTARQHHGWQRTTSAAAPPKPDVPAPATWPGLAAAVAELTARIAGIPPGHAGNDGDPGSAIAVLAMIGAAVLRELLPDAGQNVLTHLDMAVARETAGIDPGGAAE